MTTNCQPSVDSFPVSPGSGYRSSPASPSAAPSLVTGMPVPEPSTVAESLSLVVVVPASFVRPLLEDLLPAGLAVHASSDPDPSWYEHLQVSGRESAGGRLPFRIIEVGRSETGDLRLVLQIPLSLVQSSSSLIVSSPTGRVMLSRHRTAATVAESVDVRTTAVDLLETTRESLQLPTRDWPDEAPRLLGMVIENLVAAPASGPLLENGRLLAIAKALVLAVHGGVSPVGLAAAVGLGVTSGGSVPVAAGPQVTPAVTSVVPAIGRTNMATTVTITGTGFQPGAHVSFGAIAATNVTIVNTTQMTAQCPVGQAEGTYAITVTNAGGLNGSLASAFTLLPPRGTKLATYPVGGGPADLAIDAAGHVWVACYGANRINRLDDAGAPVATYAMGALSQPAAIVVDGVGTAWVSLFGTGRLRSVTQAGVVGAPTNLSGGALSLVKDAAGSFWASHFYNDSVDQINAAGAVVNTFNVGSEPNKLAVGGDGSVWVACEAGAAVYRIQGGAAAGPFATGGACKSVAVDAAGNGWAINQSGDTVRKFSSAGAVIDTYGVPGTPSAVAIDVAGNAWVACSGNNSVYRVDAGGVVHGPYVAASASKYLLPASDGGMWVGGDGDVAYVALDGTVSGPFAAGMTIQALKQDTAGNLWVANFGNNVVTKHSR